MGRAAVVVLALWFLAFVHISPGGSRCLYLLQTEHEPMIIYYIPSPRRLFFECESHIIFPSKELTPNPFRSGVCVCLLCTLVIVPSGSEPGSVSPSPDSAYNGLRLGSIISPVLLPNPRLCPTFL